MQDSWSYDHKTDEPTPEQSRRTCWLWSVPHLMLPFFISCAVNFLPLLSCRVIFLFFTPFHFSPSRTFISIHVISPHVIISSPCDDVNVCHCVMMWMSVNLCHLPSPWWRLILTALWHRRLHSTCKFGWGRSWTPKRPKYTIRQIFGLLLDPDSD